MRAIARYELVSQFIGEQKLSIYIELTGSS